jgi:hypothetical protein
MQFTIPLYHPSVVPVHRELIQFRVCSEKRAVFLPYSQF